MAEHWLVKTEPSTFSIADLAAARGRTTAWDGVRNYQARNNLKAMRMGDGVLIYHSRAEPLAIVGWAEVTREHYPDPTQFDPKSPYHDPGASPEASRWACVNLTLRETFPHPVTREALKATVALKDLPLLRTGSRLSVSPVSKAAWGLILAMARG